VKAKSPATESSPSLLVHLNSVLERLDLASLFPTAQPLEVELGCGDASFLAEYSRRHPERNYLGVERLLGRIQKLHRKGSRLGLTNLRGVRIESAYFLEYLLPPDTVTALHIYFPDPWPKLKHRRHRLIQAGFTTLVWQALKPGGVVYLRTDDADYFRQMNDVFGGDQRFCPVDTPAELEAVTTDFEREFNARGIVTRRIAYQRS
jgi:tRNA (guanine-N7-)-methyltransferase